MRHSSLLYFSLFILHSSILLFLISCSDKKRDAIGQTEVLIETSEGDIVVRLYDDTPVHRDNFIRNAEAGIYDGLLFNRIVPEMVIQSGDTALKAQPLSKGNGETAAEDATGQESLPSRGDLEGSSEGSSEGAALPPEIIYPRHFHKQGALAAAREPDSINPGRRSSPPAVVHRHGQEADVGRTVRTDGAALRGQGGRTLRAAAARACRRARAPAHLRPRSAAGPLQPTADRGRELCRQEPAGSFHRPTAPDLRPHRRRAPPRWRIHGLRRGRRRYAYSTAHRPYARRCPRTAPTRSLRQADYSET